MGLRDVLDFMEKRRNLLPLPGIEPRLLSPPVRSLVTIPTDLSLKSIVIIHMTKK
jgi:hypothetical protein